MTAPARWTPEQMQDLAAKGAGKVDLWGHRGATMVSLAEVEAMAGIVALWLAERGQRVIHPPMLDGPAPDAPLRPMRGPADG